MPLPDINEHGVLNAACIEGLSPFDFEEVPVLEGRSHPKDRSGDARVAGWLRYQPNPEDTGRS